MMNSDGIIATAHTLRNGNPVTHSSAELIDDNNSSNDLLQSIFDLENLISSKLDSILLT
jgi:hypothetical protein